MICVVCQVETKNPKFCSRSCSAKHTNKTNPKRQPQGRCYTCQAVVNKSNKFCKNCKPYQNEDCTIQEAIDRYAKHHKSSAFAIIRTRARSIAAKLGWTTCVECGYSKHVEIAHIKSISSFPLETKISVVNDTSNLKPLCPNCHWEFDN